MADVSLLVALPHDEPTFLEQLPRSDYLRKWRRTEGTLLSGTRPAPDGAAPAARWPDRVRAEVGEPLTRLCAAATELGVDVVTRATLADVGVRAVGNRTVIVFAHWKGPEVSTDDVISMDPAVFRARVASATTPVGRWLFDALAPKRGADRRRWAPWISAAEAPRSVLDILKGALDADLPHPRVLSGEADEVFEHADTRRNRRRSELDTFFGGLLLPGNLLELDDGLHTADAVNAAVAPDFRGVIDLSACTSSHLADLFLSRRGGDCRAIQFTGTLSPFLVALDIELALFLHDLGRPYLDARLEAYARRRALRPV